MQLVIAGAVDVTTYFHLRLAATGLDATGLTISDIDLQYVRAREVPVAKVDAVALAATNTAHTDNRGIEVDATDQPGLYRIDWPDAAFAAGGENDVYLTVKVATAFTETLHVRLMPAVRGLSGTALPNAVADAAGGLAISDAGGLDLDAKLANTNEVTVARMGALTDWINGGRLDLILDIIAADTTTDIPALIGSPAVSVSADLAAVKVDTAAILVDTGTTLDGRIPAALVSGRMDASVGAMAANVMTAAAAAADLTTELQTGLATAAALATVDGIVDDILLDTAEIGTAGAGLTNINLPNQTMDIIGNITGNVSGSVGSVTGAVGSVTGAVGSVTTVSDKTGYRLSATGVDDILDEVVEGSYTVRQYLRGLASSLLAKLSGAATATVVIRDTGDTKDRVTASCDADGNRSAITLDLS
jgi:hypothetical protein